MRPFVHLDVDKHLNVAEKLLPLCDFKDDPAKVLRLVIDNWEHPARKEKVARLYRLDIGTKRRRARAAGEPDPDARTHCKGPLCRAAGRTTNPARWPLCPNLQQ
jgi:hypothetical protein